MYHLIPKKVDFKNFYLMLRLIYMVLIVLTILGISAVSPNVLTTVQSLIKLTIAIYLIYKFNLLTRKSSIDKTEQLIIYTAGVYLFLSTSFTVYVLNYIKSHPFSKETLKGVKTFLQ